jgi:hypothetical protein
VSARPDVVTTLEAINLANGPELSGLVREGAERLARDAEGARIIDHVFTGALARKPTTVERKVAESLLGSPITATGREDFLWMIFMLPEFLYVN